jgi:tetratricopeptide (TPR) repeat protein
VDRTIRICSLALAVSLALGAPVEARKSESEEADLFWAAQRADLSGQSAEALKGYDRLLGKLPQSAVAVDRLFDIAVLQGNFAAAMKAARAQELAGSGTGALPLIFYVDAWKRKDWAETARASAEIQAGSFGFMAPLLNAWTAVAQGGGSGISGGTLRENGTLAYYSDDQLIYFDLSLGRIDNAKRRLTSFPGFGADHARHMALSSVEYLGRNGQGEFANSLLEHIGLEPGDLAGKPVKFAPETALAALFARLSAQLAEQNVADQALYFARLSQWISSDSAFARMTLADQLATRSLYGDAHAALDGVAGTRPQWSWALGNKARLLNAQGRADDALKLIQAARVQKPNAADLKLLEAQHLTAKNDYAGAEAIYRALVAKADADQAKNGRRVTYRMLLSQNLDQRGDWPGAKAALEEAVAISDQNPQLLNSLGYGLLERREDVKRGLELVAKAHRLAPQSPAITDSLAWGHYLNGDFAKAIPLLESAVENAIDDVAINEHLGDAYWQAGRQIEARYAWRAAALQAKDEVGERIAAKIDLGWTEATAAP